MHFLICCNVHDDFTNFEVYKFIENTKILISSEWKSITCTSRAILWQKKFFLVEVTFKIAGYAHGFQQENRRLNKKNRRQKWNECKGKNV